MIPNALALSGSDVVRALGNHLWQSTLFAGVVALLAVAVRKHPARVRYWLWLAASAKFLIPFSLFVAMGSRLAVPAHPVASRTAIYMAVDELSQPFTKVAARGAAIRPMVAPVAKPPRPAALLEGLLATVWLCGVVTILASWCVQWRRMTRMIRQAEPLREGREAEALRRVEQLVGMPRRIELLGSHGRMEPGVFGLVRPVLLWPEGISEHLDDVHLQSVLAHEVCHVQRRDNLTSAMHMLVEALFWFHPLVWWMERQLVKERERACDEAVLLLCEQPQAYAESILKVCAYCAESPLPCVSGITGADLKRRVAQIMRGTIVRKVSVGVRLLLLASGLAAVSVPVLLGQMRGTRAVAAVKASAHALTGAMRLAERVVSPIEPESSTAPNTLLALSPTQEFLVTEPVKMAQVAVSAQASKQPPAGSTFGVATGRFPVKDAAGKTVRFSAWIKTENVQNGYAGLWWRVDGAGGTPLAFDNSMVRYIDGKPEDGNGTVRGAVGTTPWMLYTIELPVDKSATNINFGALLVGTGTAWVDSMKVELDGEIYNHPPFDFDFESETTKGFYAGCAGFAGCTDYKAGLDGTTAYYGHQSLKLQSVEASAPAKACSWPEMNATPRDVNFSEGNVGSAPVGWRLGQSFVGSSVPAYEASVVDGNQCSSGGRCATIRWRPNESAGMLSFLYQDLQAAPYLGQTLTYRAMVRIDPAFNGVARLLVRVHRQDCTTTFREDMGDHPVVSGEWAAYEIRAPIATDAYHIEFGVQLIGRGEVWIDRISTEFNAGLGN